MIEKIRNAEAIFIGGGDQSNYIRYWKDTPVEDAINFVAAKPAPIGGTSAGMAVLGEYVYSAEGQESLTSPAALADPLRAGPDAGPRLPLAASTRERDHRPAPPGARSHRAHGRPARPPAGGWLVREPARDRRRPRDGTAHRPRDRHRRGFRDGGSPDALCVLSGAGRTAVAVQSRRAAHDEPRSPCTGSHLAGASISRRGAATTASHTSFALEAASYVRRARATTDRYGVAAWQTDGLVITSCATPVVRSFKVLQRSHTSASAWGFLND